MTTALASDLQAACARWGGRTALSAGDRTLTYGELWEAVRCLAGAYRRLGIRRGDRIVCQLPTCPEHVIAFCAAWACGAVHVGASKDLTPAELAALAERTGASAVVCQPPAGLADPTASLRAVQDARPGTIAIAHRCPTPPGQVALSELLAAPPLDGAPAWPGEDETALLLLTSGTTGQAKAVHETLPALLAKVAFFAEAVAPAPDDVHLMALPICHAFGMKLTLMALLSGGRVVLVERFTPEAAVQLVTAEQVTVLPATPTHLTLLLGAVGNAPVDSVRCIVSAAAALPAPLVDRAVDRFRAAFFYVYGCSEGFLTVTTDLGDIRRGSVGTRVFRRPDGAPDGRVAILDPEGSAQLPPRDVGEIAYGTRRPVRYWPDERVAEDGWYRTGDLGWLDEEGRLFVSGRLKEAVNRGGLKVGASEVETAVAQLEGIEDCGVIPTPDPVLGEAICACVVASGAPPSLAQVRERLSGTLARHKLPDELCLVDAVPRSPVGKVDRARLRALVVDDELPRERLRPAGAR